MPTVSRIICRLYSAQIRRIVAVGGCVKNSRQIFGWLPAVSAFWDLDFYIGGDACWDACGLFHWNARLFVLVLGTLQKLAICLSLCQKNGVGSILQKPL
jgi:hypothetical protein